VSARLLREAGAFYMGDRTSRQKGDRGSTV
jgi:hypothetical protein